MKLQCIRRFLSGIAIAFCLGLSINDRSRLYLTIYVCMSYKKGFDVMIYLFRVGVCNIKMFTAMECSTYMECPNSHPLKLSESLLLL